MIGVIGMVGMNGYEENVANMNKAMKQLDNAFNNLLKVMDHIDAEEFDEILKGYHMLLDGSCLVNRFRCEYKEKHAEYISEVA